MCLDYHEKCGIEATLSSLLIITKALKHLQTGKMDKTAWINNYCSCRMPSRHTSYT